MRRGWAAGRVYGLASSAATLPGGLMAITYHGNESADKAEIGEVVRVDGGGRVDLQAVVVLPSVFK